MRTHRNIVPLIMPGFAFPQSTALPEEINSLPLHHGISYSHDFFDAMMDRLVGYLRVDLAADTPLSDQQAQHENSTTANLQSDAVIDSESVDFDGPDQEITQTDWEDADEDEVAPHEDEESLDAVFLHEHQATGFLADVVVYTDHSSISNSRRVAFSHQLLGPEPYRVGIKLPASIDPVQYVRLTDLIQGFPVVLRVYWPNRLPEWSAFRRSFDVAREPSVCSKPDQDSVASAGAAGIFTKGTFHPVLPAGVGLPSIQKKRFHTARDNQKVITVTPAVCQSDGTVRQFSKLKLSVLPATAGVAWMEFTFRVDPDVRYTILARDPLHAMKIADAMIVQ